MATKTNALSFKGWSLVEFLKGRKRLLATGVGTIATYLLTQNPALSGVIGAGTELIYALFDYYLKE